MTLWKYKRKNTLEIKHNWKTTTDLFFKWLLHLLLTYLFIINTAAAFFFFSSENSVTPEEFTRGRLVGMWTSDVGLANWSECFPSCSFVEFFPKLWRFESNLHSFSGGLQPSEFKGPLKLPPPSPHFTSIHLSRTLGEFSFASAGLRPELVRHVVKGSCELTRHHPVIMRKCQLFGGGRLADCDLIHPVLITQNH